MRKSITGDTWRACLAREYQALARFEVRNGRDWSEAIRLADKGRAALGGPEPATRENRCDCAKAEARRDAFENQTERGDDTSALRKSLDEATLACAAPR
ncbi:MAG: hypothetical protein K8S25_03940 [Alphaproteobacteria bacterium]|nr:hypothetical protein [Alphaproteobacteria bacterium]